MNRLIQISTALALMLLFSCSKNDENLIGAKAWVLDGNNPILSDSFKTGPSGNITFTFDGPSFCHGAFGVEIIIEKGNEEVVKTTSFLLDKLDVEIKKEEYYNLKIKIITNPGSFVDCAWLGKLKVQLNY